MTDKQKDKVEDTQKESKPIELSSAILDGWHICEQEKCVGQTAYKSLMDYRLQLEAKRKRKKQRG